MRARKEGDYPLYLDGATCGCYGTVVARETRAGIPWTQCPLHAAAPALAAACAAMLRAADELMTEYVSKRRAANWGVINQAMVDAGAAIRKAKP